MRIFAVHDDEGTIKSIFGLPSKRESGASILREGLTVSEIEIPHQEGGVAEEFLGNVKCDFRIKFDDGKAKLVAR